MKKIGLLTLVVLVTVVLTLSFSAAAAGPKAAVSATPAAAAVAAAPAAVAAMPPAQHPHIQAALEAMRHARHELDDAAHDFHGHRVEAVKHLDAAIHEAELCEQEP